MKLVLGSNKHLEIVQSVIEKFDVYTIKKIKIPHGVHPEKIKKVNVHDFIAAYQRSLLLDIRAMLIYYTNCSHNN